MQKHIDVPQNVSTFYFSAISFKKNYLTKISLVTLIIDMINKNYTIYY